MRNSRMSSVHDGIVRFQCKVPLLARLVCFPWAGGMAWMYGGWAGLLPDHVELLAVELPGRGHRSAERPIADLDQLLEVLSTTLIKHVSIPVVFFGHSFGGLIAFELARKLRREHGFVPSCLIVSGCRAPQLSRTVKPLHALPDAEFLEVLQRFETVPPHFMKNTELQEVFLPALRADFQIAETYCYREAAPFACPLFAIRGESDPFVDVEACREWRKHTTAEFRVRCFMGGHHFINAQRDEVVDLICTAFPTVPSLSWP